MSSQIKGKSNRVKVIQRVTERKERVRCIECLGVSCGWGCWDLLKRAKVHEETAICGALNVRGQVSVARDMLLFQQPLPESTGRPDGYRPKSIDYRWQPSGFSSQPPNFQTPTLLLSHPLYSFIRSSLLSSPCSPHYLYRLNIFIFIFSHSISSRLSLFPFSIFLSAFYPSHHFSSPILLTISPFTTRCFHYPFSPLLPPHTHTSLTNSPLLGITHSKLLSTSN